MGISVGLVGLGQFGSTFAGLFLSHPMVDRLALCDLEADRLERFAHDERFAPKLARGGIFRNYRDLLDSEVDAVALFTQPWLHAEQAVEAMERGKHVYSAVPVVMLPDGNEMLDWCHRIIETCLRTGMRYMLGETTVYHADAMFCRRKAREGAFGEFIHSEGDYLHSFDSPGSDLRQVYRQRFTGQAGEAWRTKLEEYRARGHVDSPMHYPTHSASGPISVMGSHAVKVSAWGTKPFSNDPWFRDTLTGFGNVTALFRMSNGATLRICEHRECSILREDFRVYGTKASYEFGTWYEREKPMRMTPEEMRDPLPADVYQAFAAFSGPEAVFRGHGGSHPYLVHEFVSAVAEDRMPFINAWEAARYMAAGVTAHQSALRDGEVLSVPDWGDAPS
jgi:predicted dehydrogenase